MSCAHRFATRQTTGEDTCIDCYKTVQEVYPHLFTQKELVSSVDLNTSGVRTGRLSSAHPNVSNSPKADYPLRTTRFVCVGCEALFQAGGSRWISGEQHLVGCPTELAELRAEIKALRAALRKE